jgi:tRNA (guanine6-N2)-methyltransferase
MTQLFAVTSRGLEDICADEMRKVAGLQVDAVEYRRVSASLDMGGDMAELLKLKTVDDVFLYLDTWEEIVPQRSALTKLTERSREVRMGASLKMLTDIRPLSKRPLFSVTANFVGKRNYSSDEIKAAVAEGISDALHWQYTSEDLSDLNIRVFLEHETATLGVRLSDVPMHARVYKQVHISGSLKPTVAAAMLAVGNVRPEAEVCDPFCGAGTILIEARLSGARSFGGDIHLEAIHAAQVNSLTAGVGIELAAWDAQRLPLDCGSVEQIVTNLPWGRQVVADENMAAFYHRVCHEFERVLKKDGQILLLTSLPELVEFEGLEQKTAIEISLFGQMPNILRYSS